MSRCTILAATAAPVNLNVRPQIMQFPLAMLLFAASFSAAAADFAVEGGYGFDALKPITTKCRLITRQEVAKFGKCEYSANGDAFGIPSRYHRCEASSSSEYFIYESKAKCRDAIETMRANGP